MKRLLLVYLVGLAVVCVGLYLRLRVDADAEPSDTRLVSTWVGGVRTHRAVIKRGDPLPDLPCPTGCTLSVEHLVDSAPVISNDPRVLSFSLVVARDGLSATLGDRTVYATPDDLIAWRATAGHSRFGGANIMLGIRSIDRALDGMAGELGVSTAELIDSATLRRIVVRPAEGDRRVAYGVPLPPEAIDADQVRAGVMAAAHYLARHVLADGSYNFIVDQVTGLPRPDRSIPRHAGATFFLADAAGYSGDPKLREAAIRAAAHMRDQLTLKCGDYPCVGYPRSTVASLGSTACAAIVYAQIMKSGWDARFEQPLRDLTAFIRAEQRPDGEFRHYFDVKNQVSRDEQTQYVNGQATLALAMAYDVFGDPADLEAAKRALVYETTTGWDFFGSRYFFGNEHWTCQAMAALWDHAPDPHALEFCMRFSDFSRLIQDDKGGFNLNPIHIPRMSESGSRTEAGAATLNTAVKAGIAPARIAELEHMLRRSSGYLRAYQLTPGPAHLLRKPDVVHGGFPGSAVDPSIRVDFPQHAGSGMLRFLRYLERKAQPKG